MIRDQGFGTFSRKASRSILRPFRVLRDEGPRSFSARVLAKAHQRLAVNTPAMLVKTEDAAQVDWTIRLPQHGDPITVGEGPVEIAWIMSPPGKESGGHQNLFRFIDFAEKAGHRSTIYLYSAAGQVSIDDVHGMLRSTDAYPKLAADIVVYDSEIGVKPETQALFATGWETAYPAYLDGSRARRFYFVQDLESSFYPLGTESLLAENTYRFGFHGITAGGWLAHTLNERFGMTTDSFDFAVDKRHYSVTNTDRRTEIFFYARPVTPRRAFEFGLLALKDFHSLKPDVTINLAGWDVSNWKVPFPYKNLASLEISELNGIYNRCGAGLVLSLSNMSLLPLELISSGVTPVVNDGENNRMVSDNPYIEYVPASPMAIARALAEALDRPDAVERSIAMSESVAEVNWQDSGDQFVAAFERAMRG
ncbi:glycosyltransferase family 1 protein [Leifsonia sp. NPDC058230]|uniref:rhamnosyltransferase WsaF family glycosyltransferase n=1 Tax=Leifsonia sp. NPDC058230 TaxID=3346391 RepID=UPI0036DCE297